MLKLEQLATEKINPLTRHIDTLNTLELAALINQEDAKVAPAVARELPAIAAAIDVITDRLPCLPPRKELKTRSSWQLMTWPQPD